MKTFVLVLAFMALTTITTLECDSNQFEYQVIEDNQSKRQCKSKISHS